MQIPQPERFAIHKLIVAGRWRGGPDALTSRKDRAQAALLVEALVGDRPEELCVAREWRRRIDASPERIPEKA